ncbi:ligand-binding protein SH3 [Brachyspira hyodysenteriae]|uniref:ligand-binding protein SH3 n=1 Tax=Brachyspira hyodysenteriae TaxID=159 RepID=UPI0022CD6D8F|nr:ligand-binding protein SH3 [Brachyspira hyodysenteriae]MCZ9869142.1 ligand-binding protein SH3 [Brachyspira hyodysenteriae]MCZ9877634.1 ligand-binding protein SH3 [Brachyspira hyodysenteriae]MCZ9879374.1 ligand-binding protein SH3 [Brachyspira hyodysenteriae]MCZ9896376.1 ligand-binding protein SH3 [Brachyspira hyodysenteriae]MCZ9896971.1 ligand-binding protein SH3 [Brachyspira hyodysenteriae]
MTNELEKKEELKKAPKKLHWAFTASEECINEMKDYARKYNMSLGEYIEANSLNMKVSEYLVELHKMYINEIYKK